MHLPHELAGEPPVRSSLNIVLGYYRLTVTQGLHETLASV